MHVHADCSAPRASASRALKRRDGASRALVLLIGIFTFLIGSHALLPERAQAGDCSDYEDKSLCREAISYESARGLGLGTGVRATGVSTSALAYSPGALALGNLYHIEGNIDYIGVGDAVALGGGVVDSSTSKLGAGLGLRGFLSGDGGYDGLDGRLGLGFALAEAFAIGLGGRYISVSQEEPDPEEDDELRDVEVAQGFTLDASLRVIPTEGLQIDIAALNFVDLKESEVPVTIATGMAFAVGDAFSLGADVLIDVSTFDNPSLTVGGGLEFLAANMVPLRGGYRGDLARKTHAVTVGIGYNDAQVGFDIGLRQNVASPNDAIKNETRVMAAVRYFVN
jgi:hypothetical protein